MAGEVHQRVEMWKLYSMPAIQRGVGSQILIVLVWGFVCIRLDCFYRGVMNV